MDGYITANEGLNSPNTDSTQLSAADSSSLHVSLGLFLASQIASAHHGMLTIDSAESRDTKLTLAFPVEEEELFGRD